MGCDPRRGRSLQAEGNLPKICGGLLGLVDGVDVGDDRSLGLPAAETALCSIFSWAMTVPAFSALHRLGAVRVDQALTPTPASA
jgi:hypothetical protein